MSMRVGGRSQNVHSQEVNLGVAGRIILTLLAQAVRRSPSQQLHVTSRHGCCSQSAGKLTE